MKDGYGVDWSVGKVEVFLQEIIRNPLVEESGCDSEKVTHPSDSLLLFRYSVKWPDPMGSKRRSLTMQQRGLEQRTHCLFHARTSIGMTTFRKP